MRPIAGHHGHHVAADGLARALLGDFVLDQQVRNPGAFGVAISAAVYGAFAESTNLAAAATAGILVNATSVGMHPKTGESPIRREFLRPGLSVLEIVYNPIETRLLADARAAGAVAIPGMEMLLWQAAEQERVWLGVEAPVDEMREALLSGLGRSL